jgi:hypothetical protein
MDRISVLIEKLCPTTLSINAATIAISLTEIEMGLKMLSYLVAIIWTSIKVAKEIKNWKSNEGKN